MSGTSPASVPSPPAAHCAFVPPYLLGHMASLDDHAIGSCGRQTLVTDAKLRNQRSEPDRSVLADRAAKAAGKTRVVHSADNTETTPGREVRTDGDQPSGDVAVDEAFDSSGQVLSLFADQFHRDAIDGRGGVLSITVHYGQDYDNAFWDGSQLIFGDGDGVVFERFTKPMDVMAHEFTHGVTQFTAGLAYQGQSGALNESVSDVFASMTKQRVLGQTSAQADWLIGQGLFLPSINAKALRSMLEPGTAYDDPKIGKDPQVGSMDDYVDTTDDNGGVHINSGIPNRAFALAATAIGGNSWERPGQVWYDTLTAGEVNASSDFAAFAQATVSSAGRLFPDDASVAQKVRDAWATVKVLPAADVPVDVAGSSKSASSEVGASSAGTSGDDPLSAQGPEKVAVRRTGGVAGITRFGELDLASDPSGPEIRRLLDQADLRQLTAPEQGADRYVYTLEYGQVRLTVPEQALTPELHQVVRLVLDGGEGRNLTPPELG